MPTDVIMPALGVAQQTGTLLKWLKPEGEAVFKGEPLMVIETDKATVEIESPASGVLANVTAAPGDQVPVGESIALIVAPGETVASDSRPPKKFVPSSEPFPKSAGITEPNAPSRNKGGETEPRLFQGEARGGGKSHAAESRPVRPEQRSAFAGGRILASPAAKRIAREHGVDLSALRGSGPEGSILTRDVWVAAKAPAAPATPLVAETVHPLSSMRRIVAERMTHSKQTAPHFYLTAEIDMSEVVQRRAEWNTGGAARKPSYNDFILCACARALKSFPSVNASFTGEGIRIHREINIGMAVALEEGLVVPVIRNAERLSLADIAEQSRALIVKAQSKKLLPLDYESGTFTVSNLGMLGVDHFVAIINPPQAAILAAGRIAERVVVDKGMFAIHSMMTATLSADHRILDGAIGARFLKQIKNDLETANFS